MDVVCSNCTVILDEIDTLRHEINLLSYLMQRQMKRKYKGTCRIPDDDQPNIDILNKLDLIAVTSFKLISNNYVCVDCNFTTPFQDTLVPHFKFHTISEKLHKPKIVTNEDDLIDYDSDYEDELTEQLVIEDECNDLDATEGESIVYTTINYPESQTTNQLEFICPWCAYKNTNYETLTEHINKMHPDGGKTKFSSCLNCGGLLDANGTCNHQKVIEKGFKPKYCSKCHEQFYMDHLLYDHHRRIHLQCDICGKTFANFKSLRHHEYIHKDGGTYKCCHCDKKFKTKSGLIYHLPKHTGNYLRYCTVCNKGFMSEAFLEEHMRIHTKVHNYVCEVCGTKFIHNSTYRLHRRWHDNPLPFECTDCGKKFKHTSILAVHRRREHTGERPYKCDACDKAFYDSTSFRSHQRVHAQVVTHKCHTCNMSFNSETKHDQHMEKIHSKRLKVPKAKCEYKVVLKPEYQVTDAESSPSTEQCFQDNLNKDASNDDSSLADSFICKILL